MTATRVTRDRWPWMTRGAAGTGSSWPCHVHIARPNSRRDFLDQHRPWPRGLVDRLRRPLRHDDVDAEAVIAQDARAQLGPGRRVAPPTHASAFSVGLPGAAHLAPAQGIVAPSRCGIVVYQPRWTGLARWLRLCVAAGATGACQGPNPAYMPGTTSSPRDAQRESPAADLRGGGGGGSGGGGGGGGAAHRRESAARRPRRSGSGRPRRRKPARRPRGLRCRQREPRTRRPGHARRGAQRRADGCVGL